jgi:hypothetical protein
MMGRREEQGSFIIETCAACGKSLLKTGIGVPVEHTCLSKEDLNLEGASD